MEKEFPAINATQTKMNPPDFARYLARQTDAKITGVFLEMEQGQLIPVIKNISKIPVKQKETDSGIPETHSCAGVCREHDNQFVTPCNNNNEGNCMAPFHYDNRVEEIIKKSRFSDMLVIDAEISLNKDETGVISDLTRTVLTKSECPVIIAPYSFYGIEEIIFAYDGSPSAVFAIKQFVYLFPGFTDKKLTILQVNGQEGEAIRDRNNILALLQIHFSSIGFRVLTGIAEDELFKYLVGRKNAFVIMGAFGSQNISLPYRQSTAVPLVKTINLPLFIAHHH